MHDPDAIPYGRPVRINGQARRWFSYADVEGLALDCRRQVMAAGYDAVVALARGGVHLAAMVSQMTDLPYAVASYDRASRRTSLHNLPGRPARLRLLLVEDVAGKGHTLADVRHALESLGHEVDVMAVCWDEASRVVPRYGIRLPAGERYLFPWERSRLAPTEIGRGAGDSDLAAWRTAFDLDGVFLPDIDEALFHRDLAAALAARDVLARLPAHPYWRPGGVIISARLEVDRERTLAWLHANGIVPSQLVLRPSLEVPPHEFKRSAIESLHVTEYVESELPIAQALSAALPYLVVWHYDHGSGRSVRIVDGAGHRPA